MGGFDAGFGLAGEGEEPTGDFAHALDLPQDLRQASAKLGEGRAIDRGVGDERLEEAGDLADDGERVVDLVGHAGRDASDRRHPLGLQHLGHQGLALRNVLVHRHGADELAVGVAQGGEREGDGQEATPAHLARVA